jgi:hypothetical protein
MAYTGGLHRPPEAHLAKSYIKKSAATGIGVIPHFPVLVPASCRDASVQEELNQTNENCSGGKKLEGLHFRLLRIVAGTLCRLSLNGTYIKPQVL